MGIKETNKKITVELDWEFIEAMACRMDSNKDKYPRGNWKEPIDVELLEDALMRHWFAYKRGEKSENHLVAIALNAMMIDFQKRTESFNLPPEKGPVDSKLIEELSKIRDANDIEENRKQDLKKYEEWMKREIEQKKNITINPFNKPTITEPTPYIGKSESNIIYE